jgi:hypothetical protein
MNHTRITKDMLIRWSRQFSGESCPGRAFLIHTRALCSKKVMYIATCGTHVTFPADRNCESLVWSKHSLVAKSLRRTHSSGSCSSSPLLCLLFSFDSLTLVFIPCNNHVCDQDHISNDSSQSTSIGRIA